MTRRLVARRWVALAALLALTAPWTACAHQSGCVVAPTPVHSVDTQPSLGAWSPVTASDERDGIHALVAMAVVLRDWQTDATDSSRGYNIGSVLEDADGRLVAWGRNCNKRTRNGTQHGEVRLIQGYLAQSPRYDLRGHVVHTTLEPCAQCAGMMILTKVARTVYSQSDPEYGHALERLALDSRALPTGLGEAPYPRPVVASRPSIPEARLLDETYRSQLSSPSKRSLVDWLAGPEAKMIFDQAARRLATMSVRYTENTAVLERARAFVSTVPDHYVPVFPWDPATCSHE